ncbi:MAG: DUF4349 domain-containing protein [Lachnospiraceae bacterium]|nr:DUF4349 domain-containing protein [Lachnospiraceae bacterium]
MKNLRMIAFVNAALIVSLVLGGCGSSSASSGMAKEAAAPAYEDYDYEGDYAMANSAGAYSDDYYDEEMVAEESTMGGRDQMEEPEQVTEADVEGGKNQSVQRMLIKNVYMNVESEDVEAMIGNVEKRVNELGGYIENMNLENQKYSNSERKTANIVARVPVEKLDQFVDEVEGESNVLSKSSNAEDVTLRYVDMQSKLESYQTEYDRISELLKEADDLDTIIALEERLTEIRYQIESYGSQLKVMKNQASYSTINLSITQVIEYTPVVVEEKTRLERMADGFVSNCKKVWNGILDFFVGLVIALPVLLIWAVVIVIIVIIIKAIAKKHRENHPKKERLSRREKRNARKYREVPQDTAYVQDGTTPVITDNTANDNNVNG